MTWLLGLIGSKLMPWLIGAGTLLAAIFGARLSGKRSAKKDAEIDALKAAVSAGKVREEVLTMDDTRLAEEASKLVRNK